MFSLRFLKVPIHNPMGRQKTSTPFAKSRALKVGYCCCSQCCGLFSTVNVPRRLMGEGKSELDKSVVMAWVGSPQHSRK